jgi:hypothetical protein
LSTGAKAGIVVGSIVGGLALIGAIAFAMLRKRSAKRDTEAANAFPVMAHKERTASLASAETQVQN